MTKTEKEWERREREEVPSGSLKGVSNTDGQNKKQESDNKEIQL